MVLAFFIGYDRENVLRLFISQIEGFVDIHIGSEKW